MGRFVNVLFRAKPAMGTPFMVATVLGAEFGVADDTAPPASPYHLAGLRIVTPVNPPAWVKPMLGALLIADVMTNSVAFCGRALPGHAKAGLELP